MKQLTLPNGEKTYCVDEMTAKYIFDEIYLVKVYLSHGITVKAGDVVFDVGANIGLFARFIAAHASDLEIYAFEPIPQIFRVLEANLEDVPARITTYNVGLGEDEQELTFYFYPRVSGDSTAVPIDWDRKVQLYLENYEEIFCDQIPAARHIQVSERKSFVESILKHMYKGKKVQGKIIPLSNVIKEHNIQTINLLKIDAENFERHVLSGIEDQDWQKIQQIAMEVHQHIKGGENLLEEIRNLLEGQGYSVFVGGESRETKLDVFMLYAISQ